MKYVRVEFSKPFVTEEITFVVNEKSITEFSKEIKTSQKNVVEIECSDGLISKMENDKVVCASNSYLPPGEYTLRVKYNEEKLDWNSIKWVVFDGFPRRIERVESNGIPPLYNSLFGEPVVLIYPQIDFSGLIILFILLVEKIGIVFLLLYPIITFILLLKLYLEYEKTFNVGDMVYNPEEPPDESRDPLQVLFFFSNFPSEEKAIVAVLLEAALNGIVRLKNGTIEIIDRGKFSSLEERKRRIIEDTIKLIEDFKNKRKSIEKLYFNLLETELLFEKEKTERYNMEIEYLSGPFGFLIIAWIVIGFLMVGANYIGDFLNFHLLKFNAFKGLLGLGSYVRILFMNSLISWVYLIRTNENLLLRYKRKEDMMEKLAWDSFSDMIKNEGKVRERIKTRDKKWLIYAYIFEADDKIKQFIIERTGLEEFVDLKTINEIERILEKISRYFENDAEKTSYPRYGV